MSPAETSPRPHVDPPRWVAPLVLAAAAIVGYGNSLSGPLVLDDLVNVAGNPSLRNLADWPAVLWPPASVPTAGRPVLNLSFALNFAFGGLAVRGYHLVNLATHLVAAIVAFLLLRQTFALPRWRERYGERGGRLALVTALLWTVHPLATGAVTYISQRAEMLMALCYLATLYSFVRGTTSDRPRVWHGLVVVVCALGMATKEVMVTAPAMVMLYDRTFIAGSFAEAWRRRRGVYVALGMTWLLLAGLMIGSHVRDRGIADAGSYNAWTYALTECGVIPEYLKLAVWPQPLVFDYEIDRAALANLSVAGALLPATFIAVLSAATIIGLSRGHALGFFSAWFFVILAPTSSVVAITFQPMAESRVYLPLLGVLALGVVTLHRLLGRRMLAAAIGLALAFTIAARARNTAYASEVRLWADTVAKRPQNARAHNAYGMALAGKAENLREETAQFETALRLRPDYPDAHNNLANALVRVPERWAEAVEHYRAVLRHEPGSARTHSNLGNLLSLIPGRLDEALAEHREALRFAPDSAVVHFNYGLALSRTPEAAEAAMGEYERALAIQPDYAEVHNALGLILAVRPGREEEAIRHFREALRLRPDSDVLHFNLAAALSQRPDSAGDAAAHYEHAVRLNPQNWAARTQHAAALLKSPGRESEAIEHLIAVVRAEPRNAQAHYALGVGLMRTRGRETEGVAQIELAAQLAPNWEEPRAVLAAITRQKK